MMKIQFIMTTIFKHTSRMRILIPLVLLIPVVSCNQGEPAPAAKKQETKMDTVKAFVLAMDSAQKTIVLPGDLLPDENVQIRAKVQGYISTIKVDIGSKVTKGQVLALIDAPELNTRVQELNAKEKAAQSRYLASKSDGVIAASELERTKNQLQADEAEYKAAQFTVSSNRQIGNYLAIVAPYNGIITKRNINVGSFVGSVGEKPLFEIENNKLLRLRVAVPEVYTNAVLIDNSGDLTTRAFPDKKFKAKLVRKSGSIDNDTRSELWEFEIPNTTGELKAGSYADVKLHFLRTQPSFVLPTSAVVTTLEKKFVIKISNNTTQWVDVRSGFNMGDKQEIFGDVKTGDTLVLKGNEELKPGRKVAVAFSK
jgi:membrane fusion protein (multidrug efflux system)